MVQAVAQYPKLDSMKEEMFFLEMPVMNYEDIWLLQQQLVGRCHQGKIAHDIVLMLEHESVLTMGKRGGNENLKVSETFLETAGIKTIQIERGGNITYHGPGQLILYPILDLRAARLSVSEYVEKLESVMIRVAVEWGVIATRDERNHGVWVGNNKLGSVGIAVRHGITFHGLSFNASVSLDPFDWINPCGLQGIGMTSLAKETGQTVSMPEIRRSARKHFEAVFDRHFIPADLQIISKFLTE